MHRADPYANPPFPTQQAGPSRPPPHSRRPRQHTAHSSARSGPGAPDTTPQPRYRPRDVPFRSRLVAPRTTAPLPYPLQVFQVL